MYHDSSTERSVQWALSITRVTRCYRYGCRSGTFLLFAVRFFAMRAKKRTADVLANIRAITAGKAAFESSTASVLSLTRVTRLRIECDHRLRQSAPFLPIVVRFRAAS